MAERRARLEAIRAAAATAGEAEGGGPAAEEGGGEGMRFRSYVPGGEGKAPGGAVEGGLLGAARPARAPELEVPTAEAVTPGTTEDILARVAPRKADWDLKRALEPRLERLDRATQRAIVDIMHEEEKARVASGR